MGCSKHVGKQAILQLPPTHCKSLRATDFQVFMILLLSPHQVRSSVSHPFHAVRWARLTSRCS